jgi:hypothetical protein
MNKFNRNTSIKILKNLSKLSTSNNYNNNNNKYFFHSYIKTNSSLYNLSRFKNGNNKNINNLQNFFINKPILIFEQQKRWHIHHHHHGHGNEEHSGLVAALTISDSSKLINK